MNQLYDRIDGTVINNLSEVNNLANNDGFLIIWVWFITWVKVTPLTLKSKPLYRLVTCIFWLSLSLAQKHIDFYNFFNKLLALGYILLSASNILWGGGGTLGRIFYFCATIIKCWIDLQRTSLPALNQIISMYLQWFKKKNNFWT